MKDLVSIVSHDAGAAEIISSYVQKHQLDCLYSLAGPALKIFERKMGRIESLPLEDAITRSDWLLCGTSWQSDLDWRARKIARAIEKPSVTFFDHWGNYKRRFIWHGEECISDKLWVADFYAEELARREFPNLVIENKGNPYLDSIAELAAVKDRSTCGKTSKQILIVSDNISEAALREHGDKLYYGYTEFDVIALILDHLSKSFECHSTEIVLRPHPSETVEKYDYLRENARGFSIIVRKDADLLDEILDSAIVIGCETMALVVAIAAGRRAISCTPNFGQEFVLPHKEIERWQ